MPASTYPFPVDEVLWTLNIGYASKLKKLRHLLQFEQFLSPHLATADGSENFVHAVDYSSGRNLRRVKQATTIYELYDLTTLALQPRWLTWPLWIQEKQILSSADHVILASRFFTEKVHRSALILENIPRLTPCSPKRPAKRSVIFYGDYRYPDLMSRMIQAAAKADVEKVMLAGRNLPEKSDFDRYEVAVEVMGPYQYDSLSRMVEEARYIWACYPSRSTEVVYAISNKFFESLYFGIPALFARDTRLGTLVEKEGIGVTVDPYSLSSLTDGFRRIEKDYDAIRESMTRYRDRVTLDYDEQAEPVLDRILGAAAK